MINGTTSTGFEYAIPETVGDDYEVLEAIAKLKNGEDVLAMVKLIDRVLGEDQREAFKEHCRVDGRVSTERVMNEFFEIFSSHDATKK